MNWRNKLLALSLGLAFCAGLPGCEAQSPPGRREIYPQSANPQAEIVKGLAQAKREHKRVIIDFGGDWCGDCQVMDIYFHQPVNRALLEKNFVLVHIFVVETMDNPAQNALAAKYGVPIPKGVPALAVLDANGNVLYAQKTGQFNSMRNMDPGSINEFLNRWKG